MAQYETTRELYFVVQAWALGNGYRFAHTVGVFSGSNKDNPVSGISWRDAIVWCNAYSKMTGLEPVYRDSDNNGVLNDSRNAAACDAAVMDKDKSGYRLPTEVEREFAARGGDPGEEDWMYMYAGNKDNAGDVAWYHGNSAYQTKPVGTAGTEETRANRLGLYDLSGNVQEWCWDWMNYAVDVTPLTPIDGVGHNEIVNDRNVGSQKAFNGGGVGSNVTYSCVAYRWGYPPNYTDNYVGFRVVRKP
jgi:formylglycine-generating enzyme required for sulfatase activity